MRVIDATGAGGGQNGAAFPWGEFFFLDPADDIPD